jgi:DNA-binding protein YbaB
MQGPGGYDLGAMSQRLSWVAEDLRRAGDQLRQAVDGAESLSYEATSSDGLVRISVNGRGRVTSLELSPYVLRQDPDTLDAALTATLNDALGQARAGSQQALSEALPPHLRAGIEQTVDDARREGPR